jgi:tetratricopeptide (TPR) repeat protein
MKKALFFILSVFYILAAEAQDSLSVVETADSVQLTLRLAKRYEDTGHYLKAAECYKNLFKEDSTNAYYQIRQADMLCLSDDYASALKIYAEVDTTCNPSYVNRCMAICYEKNGDRDSAIVMYNRAWYLDPTDAITASLFSQSLTTPIFQN